MSKRLQVLTLGCSKNTVDTEHLLAQVCGSYEIVPEGADEPVDILLINTCGFIGDAKEESIQAILEAAGSSMDQVVKTTVFLSDMNNFGAMNAVYGTFFTEGAYPARSAVEVARLPKDALVEIEVIAEA